MKEEKAKMEVKSMVYRSEEKRGLNDRGERKCRERKKMKRENKKEGLRRSRKAE